MPDHFAAFSFVDRITEYEPGRRARGLYAVPADIASFPSCLVAEAVGQLAAWVSMAHIGFRGRPVAALANETRFRADVAPGSALELAVDIESCDEHAVAYAGRASVDGAEAIELVDCLGPMLPVEEFDSPASMAERFELILGEGAPPGRFHGVDAPRVTRTAGTPACRRARRCSCPNPRHSSAITSPAVPVFPGNAVARRANPLRARGRGRSDALARGYAANAVPDDARQDALVHSAGRHARHRRRARAAGSGGDAQALGPNERQDRRHRAARSGRAEERQREEAQ